MGRLRVPGAEYDLDPPKTEAQARLIASAPQLAGFATGLIDWARKSGEEMPNAWWNSPTAPRTFSPIQGPGLDKAPRQSAALTGARLCG